MYSSIDFHFSPDEILVYLRKSRSDDPLLSVEEVLSKHETILDEWSERTMGTTVPEENKFREVESGETIADRPEVQKVLRLIESPKYKAILTVEVQRLSRGDLEDAGRLMKLLRYTNTVVITPQKTYNLQDEYDRDFFERELKRGNEFLEYQKKIMNRGRLLSVSQGNFISSKAPYGYNKVWVMEGKRKCPTLEENKEQADVVREIFDMYVNKNMGCPSICKTLDELGIKPPSGKHWSQFGIASLLQNIHYIGKVRWYGRRIVSVIENGEVRKTNPRSKTEDTLIYDGKHQGIIPEDLFYAAQEKMGRNTRARKSTKIRNPLAGLLYCQCGRAMSMRLYKKEDGSERAPARLLCDDQSYCKTSSCQFTEMVTELCKVIEKHIADFEVIIKNNNNDVQAFHMSQIKRLEVKLEELNQKEISQWEKYSEEGMPKHIFEKLNEKVLAEKEEARHALQKAKESMPSIEYYEQQLARFKSALDALQDPTIPPEQQNRLLKACIQRIDYRREKIQRRTIESAGSAKALFYGSNWTSTPFTIDVKLRT